MAANIVSTCLRSSTETTGVPRGTKRHLPLKKPSPDCHFGLAGLRKLTNSTPVMHRRYLPLVLIVALLIAFRVVGSLSTDAWPNFQPLAALFFCGSLLAPGWRGYALAITIWAVTYPIGVGPIHDLPIFLTALVGLTTTFFIGQAFSKRSIPTLVAGSILAAVVFHLITNGIAWINDPLYAKNLTGLWQSLWSGPANSPLPSWVFLRNLAAANAIFTTLFAVSQIRAKSAVLLAQRPVLAK